MRSYKAYLALIFVPYILLVAVFHNQLPLYDSDMVPSDQDSNQRSQQRSNPRLEPAVRDRSYRFRDLMLNQGSSMRLHMDMELEVGVVGGRGAPHPAPRQPHFKLPNRVLHNASSHQTAAVHKVSEPRADPAGRLQIQHIHNQSLIHQSFDSRRELSTIAMPVAQGCEKSLGSHSDKVLFQSLAGHYIYSAYYDNRLAEEKSYIRVIALLRKSDKPALYCHIPAVRGPVSHQEVYITAAVSYYEMCENHAKDYGGWILSCEVPANIEVPPCEVVVSLRSTYFAGDSLDVRTPVFVTSPQPGLPKREFSVCIPPLFGHIPSTTLVEFIELTQILGAVHFTFYLHEVSLEMKKVLSYYGNTGLISIIPWELPVRPKAIWYHGQLLAINDCLYRNMHAFQYVAFNDIDEFIVPHSMRNWSAMVQHLLRPVLDPAALHADLVDGHNFCGFTFQSAFFDPLLMGSTASRVLYDLESDLRTKLFSKVRTKAMVDPSRIFELGIHHISKPLADLYKPYYVDPGDAFLHHYRKCITDFDPKMNCQIFTHDESLSRYIPTLRHNVHHTLWTLKDLDNMDRGPGHSVDTAGHVHGRGL